MTENTSQTPATEPERPRRPSPSLEAAEAAQPDTYRPETEGPVGAADAGSPATGAATGAVIGAGAGVLGAGVVGGPVGGVIGGIVGAVTGAAVGEQLHRGGSADAEEGAPGHGSSPTAAAGAAGSAGTGDTAAPRVSLDARVCTRDDQDAGQIVLCELDPRLRSVTRLVVKTSGFDARDVAVQREHLDRVEGEGELLRLALDRRHLESLPALSAEPASSVESGAPLRIGKATLVQDARGEDLGLVAAVRFDLGSGRLHSLVLRIGNTPRTLFGGGETVEVSAGLVEGPIDSAVYPSAKALRLTVTGQELAQVLP